jgi:hypothetical protein
MGKKQPELDSKEKKAVKEWQGEISRKVKKDCFICFIIFPVQRSQLQSQNAMSTGSEKVL